jgi:hypothetical protein
MGYVSSWHTAMAAEWPDPATYDALRKKEGSEAFSLQLRVGHREGASMNLTGPLAGEFRLKCSRDARRFFPDAQLAQQVGLYTLQITRKQYETLVSVLRRGRFGAFEDPVVTMRDAGIHARVFSVVLRYGGRAKVVTFPIPGPPPARFKEMWNDLVGVFSGTRPKPWVAARLDLQVPTKAEEGRPIPVLAVVKNIGRTGLLLPDFTSRRENSPSRAVLYVVRKNHATPAAGEVPHLVVELKFARHQGESGRQTLAPLQAVSLQDGSTFRIAERGGYSLVLELEFLLEGAHATGESTWRNSVQATAVSNMCEVNVR